MLAQSFGQAQSGLFLPTRNGFVNRLIRDQVGSGSVTLPPWAKTAKVALIGAGGSGAASASDSGTFIFPVSAGGGGPLIVSVLDLDIVGRSFNYVLGAGGASASQPASAGAIAGSPGALSSIVWGSRTFTANPGQGGLASSNSSQLTALAGGAGGSGSGGDFNYSGGAGGAFPARLYAQAAGIPGGGTSGRPNGDGLRGSQVSDTYASPSVTACLPGSSWGFAGDLSSATLNDDAAATAGLAGPGVFGVGSGSRPGPGEGVFSAKSPFVPADILSTPGQTWWDLADIAGWGGAALQPASGVIVGSLLAGPGGGGSGSGRQTLSAGPAARPDFIDGGFGAGGGAGRTRRDSGNSIYGPAFGGNGGRGGGGGAAVGDYASGFKAAQSGRGGDAWLGVWFN